MIYQVPKYCSYRKNVRTSKTVLLRVASAHEVPGTTTAVGREVHGNKEEVAGRQGERKAGGREEGREGEGRGVGSKGGREGASARQREPARGRDGGQSLLWLFRTLLSAQGKHRPSPIFPPEKRLDEQCFRWPRGADCCCSFCHPIDCAQ